MSPEKNSVPEDRVGDPWVRGFGRFPRVTGSRTGKVPGRIRPGTNRKTQEKGCETRKSCPGKDKNSVVYEPSPEKRSRELSDRERRVEEETLCKVRSGRFRWRLGQGTIKGTGASGVDPSGTKNPTKEQSPDRGGSPLLKVLPPPDQPGRGDVDRVVDYVSYTSYL